MAGLFVVPIYMALNSQERHDVAVIDDLHLFEKALSNTDNFNFHFPPYGLDSAKAALRSGSYSAVLYIHKEVLTTTKGIQLVFEDDPGINLVRHIENELGSTLTEMKLRASRIDPATIDGAKTSVRLSTLKIGEDGTTSASNTELSMLVGMLCGVLIYMFIFLYGVQVMRGVIEEKTNRVVEVIITSVKPFELMLGKIVGIALVGLTQFALWVTLSFALISGAKAVMADLTTKKALQGVSLEQTIAQQQQLVPVEAQDEMPQMDDVLGELTTTIESINFPLIIGLFIFYFLGGYLLYSALFAAVGAAVDSEADSQQFMLPISAPIIVAFISAQYIIANPSGPVAFWLSVIPLTSPIVMMVRIPFGVDVWQIGLSMALLVAGFLGTTWFAGRIYRTGILMYGKKVSYRELWKWLRHS